MKTRLAEFGSFAAKRDSVGILDSGWRFREPCYLAADRGRVFESARSLYNRAGRYNRITLLTPTRYDEVSVAASRFYEACLARDGVAASNAIRDNLERSFEDIAIALDETLRDDVH